MAAKEGDKVPSGTFKVMSADGPKDITADELFKGKTVALFRCTQSVLWPRQM